MPNDSEEYHYYKLFNLIIKLLCVDYEAFTYEMLGITPSWCTKEGMMISVTHFKKACAIYNFLGKKDGAKNMDTKIL